MPKNLDEIISFILNPNFPDWVLILKILLIVFTLIVLGFIIFVLVQTTYLKRLIFWDLQEFLTYRPFGVKKMLRQWLKVRARLDTGLESEYKLALIEADSTLDDILKRMGFGGKSLGERLDKLTTATLPNLNEILEAHKTRNNIVHDPDYRLSLEEARKTLTVYERALTDLQVL